MDEDIAIPIKNLEGKKVSFDVLKHIPEDSASFYKFVPLGVMDGTLEVGMLNPDDVTARDALQFITSASRMPYRIFGISQADFDMVLKSYQGLKSEVTKALGELDTEIQDAKAEKGKIIKKNTENPEVGLVEDAPVTKIVAVILQHATSGGASDIHIEPTSENVKVRFRVDGSLYTSLILPTPVLEAVVARIKILTNMKLDEKRKPQDGRFSARIEGRKIDFRVSTFPIYFGEKVVLRILDPDKGLVKLDNIGFGEKSLKIIRDSIDRPYGMILITGPTGSGKTTTLYSMLNELDREVSNVVSLEDPVEYSVSGVNQSQVRPEINYTFANGLRSILRQDPDIIMVGEIRDKETARLAIQAALTGHLVFSTLHTNNTVGVVPRLIDMGVDPYLIGPTLICAIAQRLVAKLCPEDKEPIPTEGGIKMMVEKDVADLPPEVREKFAVPQFVYRAKQSPSCPSGTKGRMAVFELFTMDTDIEKIILTNPSDVEIYRAVRKKGMITMKEDAMLKAFQGMIPFEEVNKL